MCNESFERIRTVIERFAVSHISHYVTKPKFDMLPEKKIYKNYIVLENGAVIQKPSLKFWKIFELEKDNYNPNYVLNLKSQTKITILNQSETVDFFSKFKK